jgi:gluconokinase
VFVAEADDVIIVMGPSGCGKSTVAAALAAHLAVPFIEADLFHSEEAKALMAAGVGLTDAMRRPWIHRVARAIEAEEGERVVAACSCLSKQVRQWITEELGRKPVFILPHLSSEDLANRLTSRKDHFAGTALLASQLASLEVTDDILLIDGRLGREEQVEAALALLD